MRFGRWAKSRYESLMAATVSFRVNQEKAVEALVYLASKRPGIDVFHVCKVIFYADVTHFRKYGRPITGDTYCAMDEGPVPSLVYDIMKQNRFHAGLIKHANARIRIGKTVQGWATLEGAKGEFESGRFSRTDLECLDKAIAKYADMPFKDLWDLVHQEPAYKAKYAGKKTSTEIPYELLISAQTRDRDKIIEQLQETSRITVL